MTKYEELVHFKIIINKKSGYSICKKSVLSERIKNVDIDDFIKISETTAEAIHRYLTGDIEFKKCFICNNAVKFINVSNGWQECCSSKCSAKKKVITGVSTITKAGWKHTDKTKNKMKMNHADFSGDNNPLRKKLKENPELHIKLSENAKLRWSSYDEDRMNEIRSTFSKAQASSTHSKQPHYHKKNASGFFSSDKMKKRMFYRSSWELKVCEYLENSDAVVFFDMESFVVEYLSKDCTKKFTRIDFYVKTQNHEYIIEVKPEGLINYGNNPEKIEGLRKYANKHKIEFLLITGVELGNLNNFIK